MFSRLLRAALAAVSLTALVSLPSTVHAAEPPRVAIIVGPVGSLTPTYLALAEAAAATAQRHGATVARAYSPHATPANVLAAVADANVVVYFGHGYGHPSPYAGLNTARQNGWGLQGPRARGTHDDGVNGYLAYYGEDWIMANARPAPGFVMIYSNTCYAPGASEGGFAPASPWDAAQRVAYYSRKVFAMGGSAYFATDFDRGAADLIDRIFSNPRAGYGSIFTGDRRYVPSALTTQPHHFSAGQQIWLHRTKYTDGPPNYWYAFAGNPEATPMRSWDPVAPTVALEHPVAGGIDVDPWLAPKLRFSEVVLGIGTGSVRLLGPDGRALPAEVVHNAATGAVRLVPERQLVLGGRYTIEVGDGIIDAAGNPLAPARWNFLTRLDADPLAATLAVVMASGTHRLVRIVDGGALEERELRLTEDLSVVARSRARLPGLTGSWFEIETAPHTGWWVAESPLAHAAGLTEEVALAPTTIELELPPDPAAPSVDAADAPAGATSVSVDRRRVVDGRTELRVVAPGMPEGRWVEVEPGVILENEQRLVDRRALPDPGQIRLAPGSHAAFRFDAGGHVLERRAIEGDRMTGLTTSEAVIVSGRRFHVVAEGELAGWAIADTPAVTVSVPEDRDPS
ncbi:MAG: Ig-like domain-containing protein [Chloroflexi bacterium]|nr:Ig-like domain-containing protein [Chloroflexota bacterium]